MKTMRISQKEKPVYGLKFLFYPTLEYTEHIRCIIVPLDKWLHSRAAVLCNLFGSLSKTFPHEGTL